MSEKRPVIETNANSKEFGEKIREYKNILSTLESDFNKALGIKSEDAMLVTSVFFESEHTLERLTELNNDVGALHSLMEDFAYEIGEAYFIKIMYLKFNNLPEELVSMLDGFTLENLDQEGWKRFVNYIYGESNGLQIARLVEMDVKNSTMYQKYATAISVVGGNTVLNRFIRESVN